MIAKKKGRRMNEVRLMSTCWNIFITSDVQLLFYLLHKEAVKKKMGSPARQLNW